MTSMQTALKRQLRTSNAHQSTNHLVNQLPNLSFLDISQEKYDCWDGSAIPRDSVVTKDLPSANDPSYLVVTFDEAEIADRLFED